MNDIKLRLYPLLLIFALALCFCTSPMADKGVADAAGLTDMVTLNVVRFYEDKIADEPFISSMSEGTRARMRNTYGIDDGRLNSILILQDLGAKMGSPQNLNELSKMTDKKLFLTAKTLIKAYAATLTPEQNEELKADFMSVLRNK